MKNFNISLANVLHNNNILNTRNSKLVMVCKSHYLNRANKNKNKTAVKDISNNYNYEIRALDKALLEHPKPGRAAKLANF